MSPAVSGCECCVDTIPASTTGLVAMGQRNCLNVGSDCFGVSSLISRSIFSVASLGDALIVECPDELLLLVRLLKSKTLLSFERGLLFDDGVGFLVRLAEALLSVSFSLIGVDNRLPSSAVSRTPDGEICDCATRVSEETGSGGEAEPI